MGTFWPWCLCPDLFRGTGRKVLPSSSQLTFCELCGGIHSHTRVCALQWGPPIPGTWTSTGPWTVRNLATKKGLSGRWASEASSVLTATPHHPNYCQSSGKQAQGSHWFCIMMSCIIISLYVTMYYYNNKVHNKCNVIESSWNHPQSVEKLSSITPVPSVKRLVTAALQGSSPLHQT